MKKLFRILSLVLVLGVAFVMAGCGTPKQTTTKFKNDKDMYAFAAISTANVFGGNAQALANHYTPRMMKLAAEEAKDEIDTVKLNEYLKVIENLLGDNSPVLKEETISDKEGYETKLVYEINDILGNKTSYVIYFNQVIEGEEEKPEDNSEVKPEETPAEKPLAAEAEEDEETEEETEEEKEYTLDGIAVIDGKEYKVSGEKELDVDEYELTLQINFDENNYVVLSEEVEEDEHEYGYTVVKDGVTTMEFEFELENNKEKEIEVEFEVNEDGKLVSYEFETEVEDGKNYIEITVIEDKKERKIKATPVTNAETGQITYEFEEIK